MKKSKLYQLTWLGLLIILIYAIIVVCFHFYVPELPHLTVNSVPDLKYGTQYVTLTTDKPSKLFYLLIYEEEPDEHWIYYAPKSYNDSSELILDQFLPENVTKYILLEGDQTKNSFAFSLKPKYNLTQLANKDHIFHVIYIVPYDFHILPTFYYTKHSIFFIDPIL